MIKVKLLRENLRLLLNFSDYSDRKIARCNHCSHQNIGRLRKRVSALDFDYAHVEKVNDTELFRLIFPKKFLQQLDRITPDFDTHILESKKKAKYRKSCTVLYLEYKSKYGQRAYGKTRYFELVREHFKLRSAVMKQQYLPGEVLFIDYAGMTVHYTSHRESKKLFIFVACLGYSKKLFAFATKDMTSVSWCHALSQAMNYYQGVPEVVQFDNAKAMVTKAGRLANLNDNAANFARHFGCICDTSPVATPTDNGNAEAAVKFITQRVLAPMKSDMAFFSIDEINAYLLQEVEKLNGTPFQKFLFSRNDLFQGEEKEALNALPLSEYRVINHQRTITVPSNYMILHDHHYYSVPYPLRHQKVLVQTTDNELIVFHQNHEVARHRLNDMPMKSTQLVEHMKPNHVAESRKNKEVYLSWAREISQDVERFIEQQYALTRNTHSRAIGKRCAALQKLCDGCGKETFSSACHYALNHHIETPTDLALVIRAKAFNEVAEPNTVGHSNIRGKEYFEGGNHE